MKNKTVLTVGAEIVLGMVVMLAAFAAVQMIPEAVHEIEITECTSDPTQSVIVLPKPDYEGISVEKAIAERRSVREFSSEKITLKELSQILWAAQGITDESGKRAAPSAGALYPIELYVVPNNVENITCGIYHYVPEDHTLVLFREGNFTESVYRSAISQNAVKEAAAVIIFTAVREKTALKYSDSADEYIAMEAGHISENILLESVSLGLGAVPVGGFYDVELDALIGIQGSGESSLYLNCVGHPSQT